MSRFRSIQLATVMSLALSSLPGCGAKVVHGPVAGAPSAEHGEPRVDYEDEPVEQVSEDTVNNAQQAVTRVSHKVTANTTEQPANVVTASASGTPSVTETATATTSVKETASSNEATPVAKETKEPVLSKSQQAELAVRQAYREFFEVIKVHYEEKNLPKETVAQNCVKLQSFINKILLLVRDAPDSSISHEILGEAAYRLSSLLERTQGEATDVNKEFVDGCWSRGALWSLSEKHFRSAIQLSTENALPYTRLARLKLVRGSKLNDSEMVPLMFGALSRDPEDGDNVRLFVVALLNSNALDQNTQNELAVGKVMRSLQGEAREELKNSLRFLEQEWEASQAYAEKVAILGHIDLDERRSMMRNGRLQGIVKASLGMGL